MKQILAFAFIAVILVVNGFSQQAEKPKQDDKTKTDAAKAANAAAAELAKAAFDAHGGDKLKTVKTMVVKGGVDISSASIPQVIPATFASIVSGEKYRLEINNPFQPMKQIFDGKETFSSIQGFSLPPVTRIGFPVLGRVGETGYTVSALPEAAAKKKGFRLTTPEGYVTDFYIDEKTSLLKGFDSSYDIGGRIVTTSSEIDKYKTIDGVVIPEKYAQRFDLGQMTVYADFKAKEIVLNGEVPDDYFAMPK